MNRLFSVFALELIIAALFASCSKDDDSPEIQPVLVTKVILDADMVESYDDGIAMLTLLESDNIDVLGVTTVTGNTWAQEGMAYAIRQAEIAGASKTTFIVGADKPLREGRLDTFVEEVNRNPGSAAYWLGAIGYDKVTDWRPFYQSSYNEAPTYNTTDIDASEYIAQQIISNPGEITLVEIGPCTNVAKALQKYPSIAALTKEIVYMGGAVKCSGNTTPYAELNFLYDPEAAAICLRAPSPRQTLVSLDVCNTVEMDSTIYFDIYRAIKNEKLKDIYRRQYYYDTFQADPLRTELVWDVIAATITVDPDILLEYESLLLDVDDNPTSTTYGKSFITTDNNRQTVRMVTKVDQDKLFALIKSSLTKCN